MTVLLDTNIIMDALQERHPFDAVAKELLLRSEKGERKWTTLLLVTVNFCTATPLSR